MSPCDRVFGHHVHKKIHRRFGDASGDWIGEGYNDQVRSTFDELLDELNVDNVGDERIPTPEQLLDRMKSRIDDAGFGQVGRYAEHGYHVWGRCRVKLVWFRQKFPAFRSGTKMARAMARAIGHAGEAGKKAVGVVQNGLATIPLIQQGVAGIDFYLSDSDLERAAAVASGVPGTGNVARGVRAGGEAVGLATCAWDLGGALISWGWHWATEDSPEPEDVSEWRITRDG